MRKLLVRQLLDADESNRLLQSALDSPASRNATEPRSNLRRQLPKKPDITDVWPGILQAQTEQQTTARAPDLDGVPEVPPRTPRNGTRFYHPEPARGPASSREYASSQGGVPNAMIAERMVADPPEEDPSQSSLSPQQRLQGSVMRVQPDAMSHADQPPFQSPRSLEELLYSRLP